MGRSRIAQDANRLDEAHLRVMFTAVANAGLKRWAPDVLGTVESMYNALHEQLAISTFKVVASSFGYTFMAVNLAFVKNHSFLVSLYRNFVFAYMAGKARKEGRAAGRVAEETERMNIYRRRSHVCHFQSLF